MTLPIIVHRLLLLMVLFNLAAIAEIPKMIAYQGMLTDNEGNPRNGTFTVTFRLYNDTTTDNPLWSLEEEKSVQQGFFSTFLGSVQPFGDSVKFDRPYYLGITIKGDNELKPRVPITSVGYCFYALRADTANVAVNAGKADVAKAVEHVANDNFEYDSKSISHYALDWHLDSWNDQGPTCYLSAFGGIKLFTGGLPRLLLNAKTGNIEIPGSIESGATFPLITGKNGWVYYPCENDHIAYYKKNGEHHFYWRRSSTGYPDPPDNDETELMQLSNHGDLTVNGNNYTIGSIECNGIIHSTIGLGVTGSNLDGATTLSVGGAFISANQQCGNAEMDFFAPAYDPGGTTTQAFAFFNVTGSEQPFSISDPLMVIKRNGYVGIDTPGPTSKLHIHDGDVEIDNASNGVILKSPDGSRWRVTIDNDGNLQKSKL